MEELEVKKGDIIVDNGFGVFILSLDPERDEKQISIKYFKLLLDTKVIRYDRTQWGVDHYIVN